MAGKDILVDFYFDNEREGIICVAPNEAQVDQEKNGLSTCLESTEFNEKIFKKLMSRKTPIFDLLNLDDLVREESRSENTRRDLYLLEMTIFAAKPRFEYAFLHHDVEQGSLRLRKNTNKFSYTSEKDRIPTELKIHLAYLRNDCVSDIWRLGSINLTCEQISRRKLEVEFMKEY